MHQLRFSDNVHAILETILSMGFLKKSKYIALTCLTKTELAPKLLEIDPNLGQELLQVAKDPSVSNQV